MDLEVELKRAIEGIGTRFEEFKKENDKQIAKGVKDALAEAKLEALGQSIDDLTGKKEDLEKRMKEEKNLREELERKVNLLQVGGKQIDEGEAKTVLEFNREVKSVAISRGQQMPGDVTVEEFRAYKSAFAKYARKGKDSMTSEEVKAMQVGVDADGGFLVPSDTSGRVVQKVFDLSPIRQISNVQPISSDRLEGIEDTGEAAAGWVGEVSTRSDTNTPQIGRYEIVAHEMYAQPKATQKLLDDASVDIEAWLSGKVADKFARLEGAAFITGTGIAQPRGFATYTTAATADATRAWGQMEHIVTGVNGDFPVTANSPSDKLLDLEGAFKPAYLAGAKWVMPRSVLTKIRKFKDGNGIYIWQPGLLAGAPSQIIGYPVVLAQDMPALATDSLSLALGNFTLGYQIVDRLGVRVLRDPYTDKPFVKFYTIKRTGGGVVHFEAIKFIKFGT